MFRVVHMQLTSAEIRAEKLGNSHLLSLLGGARSLAMLFGWFLIGHKKGYVYHDLRISTNTHTKEEGKKKRKKKEEKIIIIWAASQCESQDDVLCFSNVKQRSLVH
eukprot:m.206107 g.206107  ORF g.206107 m.206107 type:complete len:106 (-) comp15019_c3_seq2:875-1192(-)